MKAFIHLKSVFGDLPIELTVYLTSSTSYYASGVLKNILKLTKDILDSMVR